MKIYNWNPEKDEELRAGRGISFDDIVQAIQNGSLLDDVNHPNTEKYSHQRLLIVEIDSYAYVVPYVIEDNGIKFLKTIYPSREATKEYL